MALPRLLDLYCGAGGASMGYARAGFAVTGVDHRAQPHYPGPFIQSDAIEYAMMHWREYDAIHASPPCQDHSTLRSRYAAHGTAHLLPDTIDLLSALALPWAVENVESVDMPATVTLCGSQFGLMTECRDGVTRYLRRHRKFFSNVALARAGQCRHVGPVIGVYGLGGGGHVYGTGGGQMTRGYNNQADAKAAMGIDWMDRKEVSQAIPPIYTEFIGKQLLTQLGGKDEQRTKSHRIQALYRDH
jgi:DNA (cytosine-5)-methyltransferase 1